ncbi:NAD-P-binding protein [Irpex rosettiformis]|uniref:NAD-P-binding protein n=1 Tax=Irpex rosettiformis TaxID=378272 RepID=A0ACB8UI20_9APHY|nr:NAD-P-binding protein [Irpex rosettiformis]
MSTPIATPRIWLITGSSSGFGRYVTELALLKGDYVIATLRKPEALNDLRESTSAERLLVLKVDVTKEEDVIDAFATAKKKFGRIDIVYNNAGYGLGSVVESTPDDAARAIFETNFWGAARVNREAIRFFRDTNSGGVGGRLIVVSSLVGIYPLTNLGHYSATKHALEALTQTMAQELDPGWNIKVSIVEFGSFRTSGLLDLPLIPTPEVYQSLTSGLSRSGRLYEGAHNGIKLGDPRKGAGKIYELSTLENPPLRLPLGHDSIQYIRKQLDSIASDLEGYEGWSADVVEQ